MYRILNTIRKECNNQVDCTTFRLSDLSKKQMESLRVYILKSDTWNNLLQVRKMVVPKVNEEGEKQAICLVQRNQKPKRFQVQDMVHPYRSVVWEGFDPSVIKIDPYILEILDDGFTDSEGMGGLDERDRNRVGLALTLAGWNPIPEETETRIVECVKSEKASKKNFVELEGNTFLRLPVDWMFKGEYEPLTTRESPTGKDHDVYQSVLGFHCTTVAGALGIIRDKFFRPSKHRERKAGTLGDRTQYAYMRGKVLKTTEEVYDVSTVNITNHKCDILGCVDQVYPQYPSEIVKAEDAPKNQSGVFFEVFAAGLARSYKSNGGYADMECVDRGLLGHYTGGGENRWVVPFEKLRITAIWICADSFKVKGSCDHNQQKVELRDFTKTLGFLSGHHMGRLSMRGLCDLSLVTQNSGQKEQLLAIEDAPSASKVFEIECIPTKDFRFSHSNFGFDSMKDMDMGEAMIILHSVGNLVDSRDPNCKEISPFPFWYTIQRYFKHSVPRYDNPMSQEILTRDNRWVDGLFKAHMAEITIRLTSKAVRNQLTKESREDQTAFVNGRKFYQSHRFGRCRVRFFRSSRP
jgi:hypothetical protein